MPANVESLFYYGEVPWHGLGTKLDQVATAEEAIAAAQLDWEVKSIPVYTHNLKGQMMAIASKRAIQRQSDGKVLSVLGPDYIPIQNREAFNFFDTVVGSKAAKYETAGSLDGGKRIWILAKVDGTISIKGDPVDQYLLLCNGHDGKMAVKMFFMPVRVVCQNTLAAAGAERFKPENKADMFYSRHTSGTTDRWEVARDILGITVAYYKDFTEMAISLAEQPFNMKDMPKLLATTFKMPKLLPAAFGTTGSIRPEDVVKAEISTRKANAMAYVASLMSTGKGLNEKGIRGTKWAAYNAVVEYVDYGRKYGGADPASHRLNNVWWGQGAQMKQRALNYLVKGGR